MNFRQLRIGTRLAIGFGVILISFVLILIVSSVFNASNRQTMMKGIELSQNKTALAAAMKSSMLEGGLAIRNIGLQTDLGEIEKQKIIIKKQRERFNEARDKLVASGLNDGEKKILDTVAGYDQQVDTPTKEAIKLLLAFNGEEAVKLIATQIDPLQQKALLEINKLVDLQDTASMDLRSNAESSANKLIGALTAIGVIVLLAGVGFSIILTRSITKPLDDAVQIAKRVAAGELSQRDAADGNDEISELLNALKEMSDNLFNIVSEVRQGTMPLPLHRVKYPPGMRIYHRAQKHRQGPWKKRPVQWNKLLPLCGITPITLVRLTIW